MARPRIPFRKRPDEPGPREEPAEGQRPAGTAATASGGEAGSGAGAREARGEEAPARPTPPPQRPDPHTRIDGIRAWLGDLDRKLGLRTYILGAIGLLALAAAVVALVLVLQLKRDAATESDVQSLRDELSGVQRSATHAAQRSVQSLNRQVTDLESRVNRLSSSQATSRRELQVAQDDIKELRRELASASSQSGGGSTSGSQAGAASAGGTASAGGSAPAGGTPPSGK